MFLKGYEGAGSQLKKVIEYKGGENLPNGLLEVQSELLLQIFVEHMLRRSIIYLKNRSFSANVLFLLSNQTS